MSAQLLDGKAVAAAIRAEVQRDVEAEQHRTGLSPKLVAVLVGDDPASKVYVRNKISACAEAGIRSEELRLAAGASEDEVLAAVRRCNDDYDIDGILVQLPLPKHVDRVRVLLSIDPAKDVDGLHVINAGRLALRLDGLVPCTPAGVIELLERTGLPIAGQRAVIVGRSEIVGRPLGTLLMHRDATVTICHSKTRDLPEIARQADILIAAIGHPAFVRGEHIGPGAIVIDVGINRVGDLELVKDVYGADSPRVAQVKDRGFTLMGDVHWREAIERASWITPVPGGIGPLTIACLLRNTVRAARMRRETAAWA
ncbi:MAG TPA: bifunctional 5,10-methylenetetrahydrofolate dehydrogenase/5,10-methenyltetrahydrofolate cyclohydrolase [Patescibacteria group bacterium]|nr:bifunctional 5,10-methylenetetrahydrofolate dehydrogenase/5,10-methenyltetrahydrofolate cyclohydrolase [Patescibacteria group bacterium]